MGTGEAQPGPYAAGIGRQHPAGNGTYGAGAPPPGFEGMASPYYQSTGGGGAGKTDVSRAAFNLTLVLRIVAAVLSVLALGLIATANKSNSYYTTQTYSTSTYYYWQHDNMKALRARSYQFLVAVSVIVLVYELVQICFACMERSGGMSCMSDTAGTLFTFLLDQVMAYLMFSASTMSANESVRLRHGQRKLYFRVEQLLHPSRGGRRLWHLRFSSPSGAGIHVREQVCVGQAFLVNEVA